MIPRQIPVEYDAEGRIRCDICGELATRRTDPGPRAQREQTFYCDYDADRYVGWPESTKPIEEAA